MSQPTIQDAKEIAEADGLDRCVILFQTKEGRTGFVSYGKTKELCDSTGKIMHELFVEIDEKFRDQWDVKKATSSTTSDLLTLPRMARRIGVTQQWLRGQADDGKVPCLKAGNRYLFNPVAVQESLASKATQTR